MLAVFLFAGIIFTAVPSAKSLNCFECSDVPHPQDCLTITTCAGSDKCFVEQYVTSGGLVLFNSGCLSPERCTINGKRAAFNSLMLKRRSGVKRQQQISSTDIPTCVSCCDGEYCNVDGCGTTAIARQDRGPRCFECKAQEDPESCRDVKACDRNQVCAIYKPLYQIHKNEWATECMPENQCHGIVKAESGKRTVTEVNRCPRCCTDDLCNHSCRQNLTVTAPTTTVVPTHQPLQITQATAAPVTHATAAPVTQATAAPVTQATAAPVTQATAAPVTHATAAPVTQATAAPVQASSHSHNTNQHTDATTQPVTHQATSSTTPPPKHTSATEPSTLQQHSHNTHQQTDAPTQPATHQAAASTTPAVTLAQHSHNTHHDAPTTVATVQVTTQGPVITTQPTSATPTTDPAVGCKIDGYIYDAPTRLCLKFFEQPKLNWTEAQLFCNHSKGQLAIITGDQKINDVLQFYKDDGYTTKMWVGATDLGNGHVFHFTDGSTLTLDPAQGQDLSKANCLYMTPGSYKLFDPCSEKNGFICERSSTIRG